MSEHRPIQPRRPPDPAGTQPKADPSSLEPSPHTAQLSLSAPGEGYAESREQEGPPAETVHALGVSPLTLPTGVLTGAGPEPLAAAGEASSTVSSSYTPHTSRFQLVFGLLGAFAAAALALAVLMLVDHRQTSATQSVPWSSWSPKSGGGDTAAQIARHVAPQYRFADGKQLLKVTGGPQSIEGKPVVLALRTSGGEPSSLPNNGVFYRLCGGGPNCSIAHGRASVQRGLLVRREALELALYTFHYIGDASQVLVTFPPPPPTPTKKGSETGSASETAGIPTITSSSTSSSTASSVSLHAASRVLLFRPNEMTGELDQPLDQTLSNVAPTPDTMEASPDARSVEGLTANTVYDSVLIQQQQSTPVLLLQPPSLGG